MKKLLSTIFALLLLSACSAGPEPEKGADVTFTGTLEALSTACFADGECFVKVDDKHVTLLVGFSQDTVGEVRDEGGIGGLENHIGSLVEVYAKYEGDKMYTLYGKSEYYIQPLGSQK